MTIMPRSSVVPENAVVFAGSPLPSRNCGSNPWYPDGTRINGLMDGWWCNNHLEKYEFVNGKDYPTYYGKKQCSKPPTRYGNFIGDLSTICSWWYAPTNIPFTTMPPFFVASSTSCLLVITNYGWFYTPSYPYCWWLPSNNETWQWKIHRLVPWFSQLEHHLHRTFNCHVWLPECISL